MFAVVEIAGQQYKVSPNDTIYVNLLEKNSGEKLSFNKVLLTSDGSTVKVGSPALKGIH